MFSGGLFITKAEEYVGDGEDDVLETPQNEAGCIKVICSGQVIQLGVSEVEPPSNTDLEAEVSPLYRTVDTMADMLGEVES